MEKLAYVANASFNSQIRAVISEISSYGSRGREKGWSEYISLKKREAWSKKIFKNSRNLWHVES